MRPRPGDVLRIDGQASVQFRDDRALVLRVTAVSDQDTYAGWIWLTGYVLDQYGAATDRREVFVQLAGLRWLKEPSRLGAPARTVGQSRPGRWTSGNRPR